MTALKNCGKKILDDYEENNNLNDSNIENNNNEINDKIPQNQNQYKYEKRISNTNYKERLSDPFKLLIIFIILFTIIKIVSIIIIDSMQRIDVSTVYLIENMILLFFIISMIFVIIYAIYNLKKKIWI